MIDFFAEYKSAFVVLHLFGVVLGLGGAVCSDFLFFKVISDKKITKAEAKGLENVSKWIWLGLAVLIVSGLALYLPEAEKFNGSTKFLVKMVVVTVIILNGFWLNVIVTPKLTRLLKSKSKWLRPMAFASGALSITSWLTAMTLGFVQSVPLTFLELLSVYLVIIVVAMHGSQAFLRRFLR